MKRTIKLVVKNTLNSSLTLKLFTTPTLALALFVTFATPFDSHSQIPQGEVVTASGTTQTSPPSTTKDDNLPSSVPVTDEQFELYKNFFYKLPLEVYHVIGKEKMEQSLEDFIQFNEEERVKFCTSITSYFQVLQMTQQALVFSFGEETFFSLEKRSAKSLGFKENFSLIENFPEAGALLSKYAFCSVIEPLKALASPPTDAADADAESETSTSTEETTPPPSSSTLSEEKKPLSTEQKEIAILLTSYFPLLDWIDSSFSNRPPFENPIVSDITSLLENTYNIKYESAWSKLISEAQSDPNYNMFIFRVYNLPIQVLKTLQKFAPSNKELCGYWVNFGNSMPPH